VANGLALETTTLAVYFLPSAVATPEATPFVTSIFSTFVRRSIVPPWLWMNRAKALLMSWERPFG